MKKISYAVPLSVGCDLSGTAGGCPSCREGAAQKRTGSPAQIWVESMRLAANVLATSEARLCRLRSRRPPAIVDVDDAVGECMSFPKASGLQVFQFSTASYEPHERIDAWRE